MSATTTQRRHFSAPSAQIVRRVAIVAALSVAIVTLLLAVPGLQGVAGQISHMDASWVIAAVALELGSCAAFVVVFRLFFDELPADAACELAWTEQGAGALLPGGGVGAMAVGGWLLRRAGISKRQVIERSSALFFLTSAVNVAALVGAGALLAIGLLAGPHDLLLSGIPILGGLVATAAVLLVPVLIRRAPGRCRKAWLVDLVDGIDGARRSLVRPTWRLIGALGYLGLDIAALGATFAASGHPLPVAPLVLGYLIGYLANLIPIPGGFGVLEGGLAGALIAYGAPPAQTAAAVIVYHVIAFWIPSLGGLLGYVRLSRRLTRPDAAVNSERRQAQPARPDARARLLGVYTRPAARHRLAPQPGPAHGRKFTAGASCWLMRKRSWVFLAPAHGPWSSDREFSTARTSGHGGWRRIRVSRPRALRRVRRRFPLVAVRW